LAERARQLGFDDVLQKLLTTASSMCLTHAVNPNVEGKFCIYRVESGSDLNTISSAILLLVTDTYK